MIPDFPTEKQKLANLWNKYLEMKVQSLLGFLGQVPSYQHHEGHIFQISQQDSSSNVSEYLEPKSVFNVMLNEVPELTTEKIREKIDQVAKDIAEQMSKAGFSILNKAIDEAGNKIDAGGKPLSLELFLEMLEHLEFSFDEQGNWLPPAIIMHPDLWEAKKEEMKKWESDPVFVAKQEELVARKREEWRAREACRKLVD